MKLTVRSLAELGDDVVLAPERWVAADDAGEGIPLGDLVVERRERAEEASRAVVLDTTHARDGLLDIPAAVRAASSAKSAKKSARAGDLLVSRLRPYLRQVALVHPRALAAASGRALAVSTEFYVLAPRRAGDDLAFLLPFLLGERAQAVLAAAQEGGHHPRVPRASLLALRVPETLVEARRRLSREMNAALDVLYDASSRYQRLLTR
ncbi:MAG: hypothetical protein KF764_31890 [Labilithrix sp.]|nr:hypothetical protein [Labilithrix sp.]MBX3219648.1 hypothetical protein [Labilithrix sp.]